LPELIEKLQIMLSPIPKISIENRAATGRLEKDPEKKPRNEVVSPETGS
jgi:hypothetical protein